jgi:hypothetical protein
MVSKESMITDMAQIVSKALHPYVAFSLVVVLVAYAGSPGLAAWAKWTAVALLSAYLFPVSYMQSKAALVARATGTQVSTRSLFRDQPNEMLLLASLFGRPSVLILYFMGSPVGILATMVGVAATSFLIALVNRVYRASFHLALLTSMLIPLVIILAFHSLVIAPFILLLGLSRYHLGEHTPAQLVVGFLIGLVVSGATFWGFGLLG